jgi:hypothetical protein
MVLELKYAKTGRDRFAGARASHSLRQKLELEHEP